MSGLTRLLRTRHGASRPLRARLRSWGLRLLVLAAVMLVAVLIVATEPVGAVAIGGGGQTQTTSRPAGPSGFHARQRPSHAVARAPRQRRYAALYPQQLEPRPPLPAPIVIRVASVATGADGQAAVNRCQGPVEVLWSAYGYANDIIQHNYCGGAWMAGIQRGLRLRIVGGTQPGLYIANGQRRVAPKDSTIAVMAGIGDLALQTCEGDHLVYIGLTRLQA